MLADQIRLDLTSSMKASEALKTSVLRMLLSELNYKKIEVQRELEDADVILVLQKEAKKRREAIDAYTKGGRTEQANVEAQELEILQAYLPKQMSEQEVKDEILKMGLTGEFGVAMRQVSPVFKGRADGQMVARIVKEVLGV